MPSIYPDRNQVWLFPPTIDEWVSENHLARFVVAFIDNMDLCKLGFKQEQEQGRPSYCAEMLLGVWLYGLMKKIRSSRKLEEATKDSRGMQFITGNEYPDHNTLWRFFDNNKKQIKLIMKETIRIAAENDMVGFEVQAIDGTKIVADVNKEKTLTINVLRKKLELIDKAVTAMVAEVEKNEAVDEQAGKGGYGLPERLLNKEEMRKTIMESLKRLESEGKTEENPTDKDSRFMKVRNQGLQQAYNAQSVVDGKNQIIVGEDVTNKSTDNHELNNMLEEAETNTGIKSKKTLADTGYYSADEVAKAERNRNNVIIALPENEKTGKYSKSNFKYDEARDEYICTEGKRLEYSGEKTIRSINAYTVKKRYRCSHKDCPVASECSKDKKGRGIETVKEEQIINAIKERAKKEDWKKQLKERSVIVEPVFGYIKTVFGIRRFSLRSLEKVKTEWSFICSGFNLKKIYKHWLNGKIKLRPAVT